MAGQRRGPGAIRWSYLSCVRVMNGPSGLGQSRGLARRPSGRDGRRTAAEELFELGQPCGPFAGRRAGGIGRAMDGLQDTRALGRAGRQHLRDGGERPFKVEQQAEILLAQGLLEGLQGQAAVLGSEMAQGIERALIDARPGIRLRESKGVERESP